MQALEHLLITRIEQNGPLRIDEYMVECLLHPTHGYYTTRDPLGGDGDFTTAPEISQMFGELVGLALAQAWLQQGAPGRFTLAELGPGRGTLMADILRATRQVPGFHDAMDLVLIEVSPVLRARQKTALEGFAPTWLDQTSGLPDAPLFFVANEFFDALPVRQFLRAGPGWRERLVGLKDKHLAFGLGAVLPVTDLADRVHATHEGDMVMLTPAAQANMQVLADRIATFGGAGLVIDYGDRLALGDSLQAVQAHKKVDPLDSPGQADLTAHVDFGALIKTCQPVQTSLTTQGAFLDRLGIAARAETLARSLDGAALDNHITAHRRLTHPDEMGHLFKVLALTPMGAAPIAGMENDA